MGWGIMGIRDAAVVCSAASMSYQNSAYNINLLSGGCHFKATHIVGKYVVEQLPGTIRYLPAIKHKFIANEPAKRSTLSLWDLCKQRFHTLGVVRNFYRSFCGVSWSAGEVVDSSFNSSSSLSVGVTSSVCL